MDQFICKVCGNKYTLKANLKRHVLKNHSLNAKDITNRRIARIKCTACGETVSRMKALLDHVFEVHKIATDTYDMTFTSDTDFKLWLENEEKAKNCMFVRRNSGFKHGVLLCHRSGYENSVDVLKRKRQVKQTGSCKINGTCTAYISTKEVGGNISVFYCSTHFGHQTDLGLLRLSNNDRNFVAGKLIVGVPVRRILRDAQAKSDASTQRLNIINRQDIVNISRQFGINLSSTGALHSDDVVSVEAFVQKGKEEGNVLYYKAQGSSSENLQYDDFVLVIQNEFQRIMFKQYGSDRICIDSTHGTTGYDFNLTSVFVVDNYEQGIPVAFCLSSRVNHETMVTFFSAVRENNEKKEVNVLMTDDAPVLHNSWSEVMGHPARYLLCTWHIDRAWQKKLRSIQNGSIRQEIYKELKFITAQLDEEKFQCLFLKFLDKLINDEDTPTIEFGNYLMCYYYKRKENWAQAYRRDAFININMYLESFHKQFKHIYQEGKKNKRVDKCIGALLMFVNDMENKKDRERFRGNSTKKTALVLPRHKKGHQLKDDVKKIYKKVWEAKNNILVARNKAEWHITSESKNETYIIKKNTKHVSCIKACGILCPHCKVCRQAYSCSCPERTLKGFICKHIHAVCIREAVLGKGRIKSKHSDVITMGEGEMPDREEIPLEGGTEIQNSQEMMCKNRASGIRDEILQTISELANIYEKETSLPPEVMKESLLQLKAALKLSQIKEVPLNKLIPMSKEPGNQKNNPTNKI